MKFSTKVLLFVTTLGALTMPMHAWKAPHLLAAIGVLVLAIRSVKNWQWHHYLTLLGAVAMGGMSMWLKYGGPDFQVGDTPILGLVLLVLRAIYQTPPSKA
jgi:hypothetical protein